LQRDIDCRGRLNPQAAISGAIMAYRQSRPETRAAIITYLKELS
jgi:cytochrome c